MTDQPSLWRLRIVAEARLPNSKRYHLVRQAHAYGPETDADWPDDYIEAMRHIQEKFYSVVSMAKAEMERLR